MWLRVIHQRPYHGSLSQFALWMVGAALKSSCTCHPSQNFLSRIFPAPASLSEPSSPRTALRWEPSSSIHALLAVAGTSNQHDGRQNGIRRRDEGLCHSSLVEPSFNTCSQKELESFFENEQAQSRLNASIHMFASMCWDK